VNVADTLYDLFKEILCKCFIKLSALSHILKKVSSCAKFNDEEIMLLCLKGFEELNHRLVSHDSQEACFVLNLP